MGIERPSNHDSATSRLCNQMLTTSANNACTYHVLTIDDNNII